MLLSATHSDSSAPSTSVDLTPVIDMVFLLLIFFLAATTFQQAERELSIALPNTRAAGPISTAQREIVINVDVAGRAIVGGRPIEDAALSALLREALETNAERRVSVRADRETVYANVARVLDVCKGAGVSAPFLHGVHGVLQGAP